MALQVQDNVVVTAIPEPSIFALGLLGAAAWMAGVRRRQ